MTSTATGTTPCWPPPPPRPPPPPHPCPPPAPPPPTPPRPPPGRRAHQPRPDRHAPPPARRPGRRPPALLRRSPRRAAAPAPRRPPQQDQRPRRPAQALPRRLPARRHLPVPARHALRAHRHRPGHQPARHQQADQAHPGPAHQTRNPHHPRTAPDPDHRPVPQPHHRRTPGPAHINPITYEPPKFTPNSGYFGTLPSRQITGIFWRGTAVEAAIRGQNTHRQGARSARRRVKGCITSHTISKTGRLRLLNSYARSYYRGLLMPENRYRNAAIIGTRLLGGFCDEGLTRGSLVSSLVRKRISLAFPSRPVAVASRSAIRPPRNSRRAELQPAGARPSSSCTRCCSRCCTRRS